MSKQTPFFKFDSASWLGGSIQFTSLECKGLFIDLCALYWESQKPVEIDTKLKLRLRCDQGTLTDLIGTLSDLGIIVESEAKITIPFLDVLMQDRLEWLEKCSKGGKKSASSQGTSSNKKEERRKKREESREKKEYTPQFEELWRIYGMKGSKSKAFKQWCNLSDSDKDDATKAIKPYFDEQKEAQYRKDFERYLSHRVFEGVLERKENNISVSCQGSSESMDNPIAGMRNAGAILREMREAQNANVQ